MPQNSFQAVLLDIEGTTTPIDFVTRVLFPFAREEFKRFLQEHEGDAEIRPDLEVLWEQYQGDQRQSLNPPPWGGGFSDRDLESIVGYLHWLMDQDRKATPLKALQGKVWLEGYRKGKLEGQVYPDVPSAMQRWAADGKRIAIFSSGSVLAQKLLFQSIPSGDLTRYIQFNFDTTTGAKGEPESYRRISAALATIPSDVVFISDVVGELDAARSAGMQTVLCVRPGGNEPKNSLHALIRSFDELF